MLNTIPIAHNIDPDTSHTAAELHTASGRRQYHAELVLALVERYPGRTAIELWALANEHVKAWLKEPQEVRRRLTDLERIGKVEQKTARRCSIRGTRQVTWEAASKQGRLF